MTIKDRLSLIAAGYSKKDIEAMQAEDAQEAEEAEIKGNEEIANLKAQVESLQHELEGKAAHEPVGESKGSAASPDDLEASLNKLAESISGGDIENG